MIAATHDGIFHSDDVFTAAGLRIALPEITIIRTRDTARLEAADIRFDVGGRSFGPTDFDHHQPGGAGKRPNGIPYAAFGLFWNIFGHRVAEAVIGVTAQNYDDYRFWNAVVSQVDRDLVQAIDAGDNGVDLTAPINPDIRPFHLASAIDLMRPTWQEEDDLDAAFFRAVDLAELVLRRAILHAQANVAAPQIVAEAVGAAHDTRVISTRVFVPREFLVPTNAIYVVYPSAGSWRAEGVRKAPGSFAVRRPFPVAWAGLSGADLVAATGVSEATFAHRGRFIVGAASREGAEKLAQMALEEEPTP